MKSHINLPRVDGREFLSAVKSEVEFMAIPVVMLTTTNAPTDVLYCYGNHANAYLTKPLLFDDWVKLVRRVSHFWLELADHPPR